MSTTDIKPELLKAQIEGFTDFEKTFAAGGGAKGVMAAIKAGSRDLWQISPDKIYVMPGYNPRVQNRAYFEGIRSLAELIKEHGYYQDKPLSCYIAKVDGEDRIVLQDGHRRFAAAQLAISEMGVPLKALPVVFKDNKTESTIDLTLALLHSNEGAPFTTYEKAVIAKRLKKYGWTNQQIAAEFHVTPTNVAQLLTMASAPQAIVDLVQNGNLSATEAHRLLMENGAAEAERIATEGMAAAKARGATKITQKDLSPADQKAKNAKKHAYDLYRLLKKYREMGPVEKHITDTDLIKIDEMIAAIEKKPKVKAEPKPKKTPAVKKVPVAKKIATASGKGKSKNEDKPEGGAEFFNKLDEAEAARKAAKGGGAQARREASGQRRSDR